VASASAEHQSQRPGYTTYDNRCFRLNLICPCGRITPAQVQQRNPGLPTSRPANWQSVSIFIWINLMQQGTGVQWSGREGREFHLPAHLDSVLGTTWLGLPDWQCESPPQKRHAHLGAGLLCPHMRSWLGCHHNHRTAAVGGVQFGAKA